MKLPSGQWATVTCSLGVEVDLIGREQDRVGGVGYGARGNRCARGTPLAASPNARRRIRPRRSPRRDGYARATPVSSARSRNVSHSSRLHTSNWRSDNQAPTRCSVADTPQVLIRVTFRSMASCVVNLIEAGKPSPMSIVDCATRPRMPSSTAARAISSGCGPPASVKHVVPTRSRFA